MKIRFSFVLLFVACHAYCQVTIDNLLSTAFPTNLTATADGKRIAWVFNDRGIRNIWVAEAPDFTARKLTQTSSEDGQDISQLSFSADGNALVYVLGGGPNSQNELPNPLQLQTEIERAVYCITWKLSLIHISEPTRPY